ncbi:MAG: DUF433 domain-containing protein, partial [Dehalococcoidia bacterium]
MRVRTIVDLTMMGMSPGAIVEEYESILLNGVHGALAFYHANQDRLDAEWVAQDIEADRLETETRAMQGPSLRERLGV